MSGPRRDPLPELRIDREAGRRAFGADPAGYDRSRPEYPEDVWAVLEDRCGLAPGTHTLEIGPGTGLATRRLVERGACPLVAVEPDERLAGFLRADLGDAVDLRVEGFEDAALPEGAFDLAVSATAFHWIDQRAGLTRVGALLRPGGWWAAWWTVFGDPERPDPFHDATAALLQSLARSPSAGVSWRAPFSLDVDARFRDLAEAGVFEEPAFERIASTIVLDPEAVRALYATFSSVNVLAPEPRARLLDAVAGVAAGEFGGRVERHITTALYTARRRG